MQEDLGSNLKGKRPHLGEHCERTRYRRLVPKGLGVKGLDVKGLVSGLGLLGFGHLATPKEPALAPQLYPSLHHAHLQHSPLPRPAHTRGQEQQVP